MYWITLEREDGEALTLFATQIELVTSLYLKVKQVERNIDIDSNFQLLRIEIDNNEQCRSSIIETEIEHIVIKDGAIDIHLDNDFFSEPLFEDKVFHYLAIISKTKFSRAWNVLNESQKFRWCRACLYYNREPQRFNSHIEIDGQFITSKYSFFCEFAENLIGIGGYFGSDLDGFEDCFMTFYRIGKPITVTWRNYEMSIFDEKSVILEILNERGVVLYVE